jgi:hypothetical protein
MGAEKVPRYFHYSLHLDTSVSIKYVITLNHNVLC